MWCSFLLVFGNVVIIMKSNVNSLVRIIEIHGNIFPLEIAFVQTICSKCHPHNQKCSSMQARSVNQYLKPISSILMGWIA